MYISTLYYHMIYFFLVKKSLLLPKINNRIKLQLRSSINKTLDENQNQSLIKKKKTSFQT